MPHVNPLPGHTSLGALLSLLAASLAFLSFPAGGTGITTTTTAFQQAPGLSKAMLEPGSLDSQVTPLDEIESHLGDILDQLRINLTSGLNETHSNFVRFLANTNGGAFMAELPSLNASTAQMKLYYTNFITSQALQSHNIIITVVRNLSIYDLSHRKWNDELQYGIMLPQNAWHVNCQDEPDEYGICDNWWVDNAANDAFALFKLDDMEHNLYDLMRNILANGWTTGGLLFGSSDRCKNWTITNNSDGICAAHPDQKNCDFFVLPATEYPFFKAPLLRVHPNTSMYTPNTYAYSPQFLAVHLGLGLDLDQSHHWISPQTPTEDPRGLESYKFGRVTDTATSLHLPKCIYQCFHPIYE